MDSSIINILFVGVTAILVCLLHTDFKYRKFEVRKIRIAEFKIHYLLIMFVLITLIYLLVYWIEKTPFSFSFYLLITLAILLEILKGVGRKHD